MRLKVNFIEPIDWKKESSIDPRFLVGSGVVVLLIVIFGVYFTLSSQLSELQGSCERLTGALVAPEKKAAEIRKITDGNNLVNNKVHVKMDYRSTHRISFSRYLMALYQIVPDNMFINSLSLRSRKIAPDPKKRLKKGEKVAKHKIKYDLLIAGYMLGNNTKQVKRHISLFPLSIDKVFNQLREAFPLHPKVETSLSSGVSPLTSSDGRQGQMFKINCSFDAI